MTHPGCPQDREPTNETVYNVAYADELALAQAHNDDVSKSGPQAQAASVMNTTTSADASSELGSKALLRHVMGELAQNLNKNPQSHAAPAKRHGSVAVYDDVPSGASDERPAEDTVTDSSQPLYDDVASSKREL